MVRDGNVIIALVLVSVLGVQKNMKAVETDIVHNGQAILIAVITVDVKQNTQEPAKTLMNMAICLAPVITAVEPVITIPMRTVEELTSFGGAAVDQMFVKTNDVNSSFLFFCKALFTAENKLKPKNLLLKSNS